MKREITEHDQQILGDIFHKADSMTPSEEDIDDRAQELRANCQICLDERWSELSCEYDQAVLWLRQVVKDWT